MFVHIIQPKIFLFSSRNLGSSQGLHLFWVFILVLYLFWQPLYINIFKCSLKFPKFCLSRSCRAVFMQTNPSVEVRCYYSMLVFVQVLTKWVCLPLIILLTSHSAGHTSSYTLLQAIALPAHPKTPLIVVLTEPTFGDFVYINGRVVLKSVFAVVYGFVMNVDILIID